MKKFFRLLLLFIMVLSFLPTINATAAESQITFSEDVGFTFINVRTPKDFDKTVYLQLMSEGGECKTYPIFSETDYMIEERIPVGTYRVIGHLDEELASVYIVDTCTSMVTISSDTDAFIELSVIPNADLTSESETDLNSISDVVNDISKSDTNLSDKDDNEPSADVSENETSLVGPLVTAVAAFIIIICIAIFVGFMYRHRDN